MEETTEKKKKPGRLKGFFSDFKAFIMRGNIIDLAIAVVIGGAFGKIVTSLVNDLIMPLITLAVGGVSVADWKWVIREAEYEAGVLVTAETAFSYGNFLQTILDFVIIAFFIFLMLRIIVNVQNHLKKLEEGLVELNNKERKALIKQLKKEGKSKKEILAFIEAQEQALTAQKAAEAEAQKAAEAADKPPSTEQLLTQIRDLLQSNNSGESV